MTAAVPNVAQEEAWNGEEGRRWTDNHRRLDRMAAPANEFLFGATIGSVSGVRPRAASRATSAGS